MTGDDGDTSRLRAGPWLPEPIVHRPPGAPGDQSGGAAPSADVAPTADVAAIEPPNLIDEPLPATPNPHAHRRVSPVRRPLLWSLAILVAISVVVAALLATRSPSPTDRRSNDPEGDVVPSQTLPASAVAPSVSGTPSPSPSRSASVTRTPFQPIGLEAEGASVELGGSAEAIPYAGASGGRIVRNLGRWGPGAKKTGSLTFSDVTVPETGSYVMTLYLVHDGGDSSRTAVISVGGGGSVTVSTAAGTACCLRTSVVVTLKKGRNAVTIDNPDGVAPSVDRVVISAA